MDPKITHLFDDEDAPNASDKVVVCCEHGKYREMTEQEAHELEGATIYRDPLMLAWAKAGFPVPGSKHYSEAFEPLMTERPDDA